MRLFIFTLILASFIQTAFLEIPLCLTMLICRSFVTEEKQNYYLAFFSGLLLGLLSTQNIGFWPLIFLVIVKLTHLIRKLPFTANFLSIVPITFILLTLALYSESLISNSKIIFGNIYLSTILSLPIFLMIKFWEERFTVKPGIKLKIG